ncbi:MAG: peptidylprolyl isomerase [Candidatus Doudnabacteria bacterium]|nr:peptidylprolyl isomerase [Candidatus Doudnabacteria bacterium]
MTHKQSKILKIVLILLAAVVLILGGIGIWLYNGKLTPAKISIFRSMPYPIAWVNGSPLYMQDYISRVNISEKLNQNSPQNSSAKIFSEMVVEEETRQLAGKYGISINSKDINEEYSLRSASTDLEGKATFNELLEGFGLSDSQYKNYLLKPELLRNGLMVWFNSQESLNAQAYNSAKSFLQKINNGENMATLAENFTQDSVGKSTQGDLGFVDPVSLLPELREPVSNLNEGEVKIIPSRIGLHIIKKEGQNGNLVHLRQIFVATSGFDQWFSNQTKSYKIIKLINL